MPRPQFPPGSSLSVRNVPSSRAGGGVATPDQEIQVPAHFQEWQLTRINRHLEQLATAELERARTVEEYAGESIESVIGVTQLIITPDFSPPSERITSVLVTGPPSQQFALQLGDRYLQLVTGTDGKVILSPVCFTLKPSSARILTPFAGITTPSVPASGVAVQNPTPSPYQVVITGGTITAVIVNGVTVGSTAGTYYVPPFGAISITQTGAPTWVWTPAGGSDWFVQLTGYALAAE